MRRTYDGGRHQQGLEHVLEFLDFSSREAPTKGVRGNLYLVEKGVELTISLKTDMMSDMNVGMLNYAKLLFGRELGDQDKKRAILEISEKIITRDPLRKMFLRVRGGRVGDSTVCGSSCRSTFSILAPPIRLAPLFKSFYAGCSTATKHPSTAP